MKAVDVKSSTYIDFDKENNKENSKFEVGDHVRNQNIETFFQKATLQIGLKKFFRLKKVKKVKKFKMLLFHGHMLLLIITLKKLVERFTKKNY